MAAENLENYLPKLRPVVGVGVVGVVVERSTNGKAGFAGNKILGLSLGSFESISHTCIERVLRLCM